MVYEIPPTRQQQLEGGPALQADRPTESQLASFQAYMSTEQCQYSKLKLLKSVTKEPKEYCTKGRLCLKILMVKVEVLKATL
jgi:hypothetical protein